MRIIDTSNQFGLGDIIYKYSADGLINCKNGSVFICPISGGPLRFLHKLFGAPHKSQPVALEYLFGFPLSADYVDFMRSHNGANLFDNSFCIYGFCTEINRGLALEDQQPISLEAQLETSELCHDPDYPWRPFGSVTGYEQLFELEVEASGRARMACDDGTTRHFHSIGDLVRDLAAFLDDLTDGGGFIDETRRGMDADLRRFAQT